MSENVLYRSVHTRGFTAGQKNCGKSDLGGGGEGKVSPRKSVVQSACQYDVTSGVSDFQNGEQSVHRRDG